MSFNPTTRPDGNRSMMNGKPVLFRKAKTVLNDSNEAFSEKLLCDGPIFNPGDACAYNCSFCYVGAMQRYLAPPLIAVHNQAHGSCLGFEDVVIRRLDAIRILESQLLTRAGKRRYPDGNDTRVLFASSTVDVAANMELLRETAEACNLIFKHTAWQVRLLSKSHLLHKLIADRLIPDQHHQRLILGFSTGTLDDRVARAFEKGTALVSKRLESLHWLQDRGLRTFGMICPSLPQNDYDRFSREVTSAIRIAHCEHVWAEPINVRGVSLGKTLLALSGAGLHEEAERLAAVSGKGKSRPWEEYARSTFLAHSRHVPPDKLRFLQYVSARTVGWWNTHRNQGAVLLGKHANSQT